jgi:opacity protein-like surface antigen
MMKNFLVALGIAALTTSSAFAAAKAPKAKTPTHKVAAAAETKPMDGKVKKEKKAKKETKATEQKEQTPAVAPAK